MMGSKPSGSRLPMRALVGLAMERFALLADPPGADPSPLREGATPEEWARAAGLDCDPLPMVAVEFPRSLPLDGHDPATVAHAALQALAHRARVESVGGLPIRYRPLIKVST